MRMQGFEYEENMIFGQEKQAFYQGKIIFYHKLSAHLFKEKMKMRNKIV